MFACCFKKNVKIQQPIYVEPRQSQCVELVKYEKVIGEFSDTSCEVIAPTPPPRERIIKDKEDNASYKKNTGDKKDTSDEDSLFNISVNHSILSEKFGASSSFRSRNVQILSGKDDNEMDGLEPLFTLNISIKNERNGVLIHRKIYL
jgi:hypothetical protein